MILVGNQRGGAKDLARHLLKDENDHVEVHEVRGFASETLMGALTEAYAVSRGTKCRQFLYSLSLNPPPGETVSTADFERAVERVEEKLGLKGQPRAIVFHEKGRRHAHAVWSRIDTESMKAVQLSFTHKKLQSVSRELFREHGWDMPLGLIGKSQSDPRNFTLEQWQQAKRIGKDPRAIKAAIQDAWAMSDSRAAFTHALEERGFKLARGDRRGFVAVDHQGEIYSVPKWAGVTTKEVRRRLGDEQDLQSVAESKEQISREMVPTLHRLAGELDTLTRKHNEEFEKRRALLVHRQRKERQRLSDRLELRWTRESRARQERFRTGLKGVWDRLRGEHGRIQEQNEREAMEALERDRAEKDRLVFGHLEQRRKLDLMRSKQDETLDKQKRLLIDDFQMYQRLREHDATGPPRRRARRLKR